jgi:hypothetical protein
MAEILLTQKYQSKDFNIPFYESQTQTYRVKIKVDKINSNDELNDRRDNLVTLGFQEFITSFIPEFYSYLFDEDYFEDNCDPDETCGDNILDVARNLENELKEQISIESWFDTSPPSSKSIVILRTSFDFDSKREQLEADKNMPLYEPNLLFFNNQQDLAGPIAETTLTVGTIGSENKLLNNGLRTFDTQYKGFEGQIELNVDFGYMSIAATKILNIIVTELTKQTRIQTPSYNFSEADTVTLFFGKNANNQLAIYGMNYLLIEESIQSQPLKIGYFSIAKYNKLLQDPLTLAILRNYRQLLDSIQTTKDNRSNYSFFDFLDNDEVRDSLAFTESIFNNFNPQPKKDLDNELLRVASEQGLIDINNTEALEKGFTTFFTSEEIQKIKQQVAENPDVYKRVAAAQKAKVLNTGVEVTKVIGNFLDQGPMGLVEKANPQLAYLFRQLGIDELAREAFLCLTFGLNVEAGRINQAVQNSLVRASSSIYYPPDKPKSAPISKPKIDLELLKPFSISGPLWPEIEKAIIDAVQQIVLEVIKKLAELLRENCNLNTPRSTDYGSNDLTDFIENNPNPENSLLPIVGAGSGIDQIASKNKMSNQQIFDYLSSLSSILSSIDICILFLNREDASDDLIDRIIEFNQNYSLEVVRTDLVSRSAIMGFFADLSAIVDVTDLCNQIANELYNINQDNVCLTEGDLQDENVQELLDLIENGLVVEPPSFDLDCPDSKFLDPTIQKSIPETFNALAESIQLQFISSAESAKEILLEPVLKNDSRVLNDLKNAGITGSIGPSIDPTFLAAIVSALQSVSNITNLEEACPTVDIPELLGFDAAAGVGAVSQALKVVAGTFSDPNFANAINGIGEKINQLSGSETAGNPVFTTYQFNQAFLNNFKNYIDMTTFNDDTPHNTPAIQPVAPYSTRTEKFYTSTAGSSYTFTTISSTEHTHGFVNFPDLDPVVHSNTEAAADIANDSIHEVTMPDGEYVQHEHPLTKIYNQGTFELLPSQQLITTETSEALLTAVESDTYQDLLLDFGFNSNTQNNNMTLVYPKYINQSSSNEQLRVLLNLGLFSEGQSAGTQELVIVDRFASPEDLAAATFNSSVSESELSFYQSNQYENLNSEVSENFEQGNLYVSKFAAPLAQKRLVESGASGDVLGEYKEAYYQDYAYIFGIQVQEMINYILRNGVFDAATLQSLNLFTLNEGCPPSELADFLDIDGIIEQMIEEYKEAACNGDDIPLASKIRNVIKFGMYLLLAQIHIAETIIKNIFVMTAFNLNNILSPDSFYFRFAKTQMLSSLTRYFDSIEQFQNSLIRQDLVSYFNLKIQRQSVINKGGITYADGTVAFPTGTEFSVTDEDTFVGFDDIIDYLVNDRLQRSRQSINNALQKAIPGKKRASFAEALLSQIPVIKYDSAIPAIDAPERNTWETNLKNEVIRDLFDSREGFYILKSSSTSAFTVSNLKVYSLWCYINQNSENMLFNVINQIATEVEGIEIAEEIS